MSGSRAFRPNAVESPSWPLGAWYALLGVIALQAIIVISIATRQFVDYDSFWHVFVAKQEDWRHLLREVVANAHPPLFYLLLKGSINLFGSSPIAYRLVSILAMLVSTALLGRIVFRLTKDVAVGVLAAAAFGLSFIAMEMGIEVRQYAPSMAFTLTAFSVYVEWLSADPRVFPLRKRLMFAAASSAAVLTHYSTFIFMAAALLTPIVLACGSQRRRRWLLEEQTRWLACALMFGPPLAAAALLYRFHVTRWATRLNHVPAFMYDGRFESVGTFLWRTGRSFVRLFLPAIEPHGGILALLVLLLVTVTWVGRQRTTREVASRVPAVFLGTMVILNVFAALVGRYPFGGQLRHEVFLFPFVLISVFVLVGEVREMTIRRAFRRGWIAAGLLSVGANCWLWLSPFHVTSTPEMHQQIEAFRREYPNPPAVLVDQFNFIVLFGRYHDWDWHLAWENVDRSMWQLWRVSRANSRFDVCRTRDWQLDFSRLTTYQDVEECLNRSGMGQVAIFRLQQEGFSPSWNTSDTSRFATSLGARMRLRADSVLVQGADVYALFEPIRK
jgi:uncharacterized membrane protein